MGRMETTKPERRWYQFSLRMLLIVLTFACVATAWTVDKFNWKNARWRVLDSGAAKRVYAKSVADRRKAPGPPWSLRMVGEWFIGADALELPKDAPEAELLRIQELFPELPVRRKRD
jgi:hypothetical protein